MSQLQDNVQPRPPVLFAMREKPCLLQIRVMRVFRDKALNSSHQGPGLDDFLSTIAILAYRYRTYAEEVSKERLKTTVDILLRERGCTLQDLLDGVLEDKEAVCDYPRYVAPSTVTIVPS
ncbi:hypothetical protein FVEG_03670 [Fusarium verticillioides 7600]|uniref:Uncharacterized protein n=1 Tax=Gibberella moniliformis (strain M3125 / FGSC 7600) TaxID=334819 RepID=W7LSP7_GIBM7|nr:hypothetical protein FVEG_03670 [Fusarium verticillioides 7600]EWG41586.1 hypothetical protein FVEG_03670 [Fusarium verticillioides 7600]